MRTGVRVELHVGDGPVEVRWYGAGCVAGQYGVIDLGEVKLFLDPDDLDRLEQAVEALQRERRAQEVTGSK